MKLEEYLGDGRLSRRSFIGNTAKLAVAASLLPLAECSSGEGPDRLPPVNRNWVSARMPANRERIIVAGLRPGRVLLKNGLIVDGSGSAPYYGDLLMSGGTIEMVTPKEIVYGGETVDCVGKAIIPGIIDAHSHLDLYMPASQPELKTPFIEQGITTVVAGNCGHSAAGFKRNSPHMALVSEVTQGLYPLRWSSMAEYFNTIRQGGLHLNLHTMVGHGVVRHSIRGNRPEAMNRDEMREMLSLFDEAMEQGAGGVSLGLQYEPGVFATIEELKEVARLVKSRGKVLTSHMKAYSSLSGTYPLKLFGRAHNLLAIEDMLRITRETEVKMQLSHLIFVGSKTWKNCGEALGLIDGAIRQGLDVMFDTYAYHCGTSVINVFMPEWFLAIGPSAYNDSWTMMKLRAQIELIVFLLGFGYDDIQILDAKTSELAQYNGMFLRDIAERRGMGAFDNYVDIARRSGGRAKVLNHRYSSLQNVKDLMRHRASLFMTDATVYLQGAQNPASFGNYPRFFQLARDFRLLTIQETVRKMTGAVADRFSLANRGYLREGYAADVTVFDWNGVRDNNTLTETNRRPSGIARVYINGRQVVRDGVADGTVKAGVVL
ncbi:MAG: amidohydrolase family protein [Spirochaetes bacterium]|nr:amidohydrolase family protein [Spirochaetota bacterium]